MREQYIDHLSVRVVEYCPIHVGMYVLYFIHIVRRSWSKGQMRQKSAEKAQPITTY